eukprot:symbB.v1.2.010566.t1/scaffold691.1/size191848/7
MDAKRSKKLDKIIQMKREVREMEAAVTAGATTTDEWGMSHKVQHSEQKARERQLDQMRKSHAKMEYSAMAGGGREMPTEERIQKRKAEMERYRRMKEAYESKTIAVDGVALQAPESVLMELGFDQEMIEAFGLPGFSSPFDSLGAGPARSCEDPMWCYLLLLPLVSTAEQCDGNVLLQHAHSGPTALVEDEVSKSVCSNGRLMPNFYILGSAKAGSSTLGKVLLRAGITSSSYVVDGERKKESQLLIKHHFFEEFEGADLTEAAAKWRFAQKWYELFPQCSEQNVAKFLVPDSSAVGIAEMTPYHLTLVKPQDLDMTEVVGPLRVGGGGAYQGFDFPPVLHHIYGQSAPKVRFCLTMREPISRTQSELYMIMRQGGLKDPAQNLTDMLEGYISSGKPSRLLWTSFYGQHLRGWFSSWNASQFLVLPYKLMSTKPVAVCRSVMAHLQTKLNCADFERHGNSAKHPTLEEDVPQALLQKANEALEPQLRLLVQVLLDAEKVGAVLPVLETRTFTGVRDWILNGWDGSTLNCADQAVDAQDEDEDLKDDSEDSDDQEEQEEESEDDDEPQHAATPSKFDDGRVTVPAQLDEAPALFKEGARLRRNAMAGMEEGQPMDPDELKRAQRIAAMLKGTELKEDDDVEKWMSQRKNDKTNKVVDLENVELDQEAMQKEKKREARMFNVEKRRLRALTGDVKQEDSDGSEEDMDAQLARAAAPQEKVTMNIFQETPAQDEPIRVTVRGEKDLTARPGIGRGKTSELGRSKTAQMERGKSSELGRGKTAEMERDKTSELGRGKTSQMERGKSSGEVARSKFGEGVASSKSKDLSRSGEAALAAAQAVAEAVEAVELDMALAAEEPPPAPEPYDGEVYRGMPVRPRGLGTPRRDMLAGEVYRSSLDAPLSEMGDGLQWGRFSKAKPHFRAPEDREQKVIQVGFFSRMMGARAAPATPALPLEVPPPEAAAAPAPQGRLGRLGRRLLRWVPRLRRATANTRPPKRRWLRWPKWPKVFRRKAKQGDGSGSAPGTSSP